MIILDTNVLSELMRQTPDQEVVAWLDNQPRISIWTTSITVLEIRFGLQILPRGRRRSLLILAFDRLLHDALGQRIASFDTAAAQAAADLMEMRHKRGRPAKREDAMIAGIVLARHATLATRNARHFGDLTVSVVDPWHFRLQSPFQ